MKGNSNDDKTLKGIKYQKKKKNKKNTACTYTFIQFSYYPIRFYLLSKEKITIVIIYTHMHTRIQNQEFMSS